MTIYSFISRTLRCFIFLCFQRMDFFSPAHPSSYKHEHLPLHSTKKDILFIYSPAATTAHATNLPLSLECFLFFSSHCTNYFFRKAVLQTYSFLTPKYKRHGTYSVFFYFLSSSHSTPTLRYTKTLDKQKQ